MSSPSEYVEEESPVLKICRYSGRSILSMGLVFLIIFAIGYGMGDSDYFAFLFIGIPFFGLGITSEIAFYCGLSKCSNVLDLSLHMNDVRREGAEMSRTRLDETDAKSKSDANTRMSHIGTISSSSLEIDISSANL